MQKKVSEDYLIFTPADIDLSKSPLRKGVFTETYVLGVFNPGMERLPNGNILLMVRVAEAIKQESANEYYSYIKWKKDIGFSEETILYSDLDTSDPRKYIVKQNLKNKTYCLTSFSWILPVELNQSASDIVKVHYDKALIPVNEYQEYGIEDARLTKIENKYYLTACAVSALRHSTVLYESEDGINFNYLGVIMDHQNKDMVLFPEKIGRFYYALTRPVGDHYFYSPDYFVGPNIQMSQSPDLLHWKPVEEFKFKLTENKSAYVKFGGGAPPILYDGKWLVLFHAVIADGELGRYETFHFWLDKNNPAKILKTDLSCPVLKSEKPLSKDLNDSIYMDDVVFTTGIIDDGDQYIVASGELDLYCRITRIEKGSF